MKYFIALVASLAILFLYAIIGALLDWRNGGGYLPQFMLWTSIVAAWGGIVGLWPAPSSSAANSSKNQTDKGKLKSEALLLSQDCIPEFDDASYYAMALKECEGTAEMRQPSIWGKAFAMTEGDANKTRAKYIELRVAELARQKADKDEQVLRSEKEMQLKQHQEYLSQKQEALYKKELERIYEFTKKYPIGNYFPTLHKHYGYRVWRMATETDTGYSKRLQRFAEAYEKETRKKIM